MKIILGSSNKDKVEILKKALEQLHLDIKVEVIKVDSEITDQPLDKDITLKGSQNRARNAKKAKPDADFYFGLEGGLHDYGEGYHLVTYATLIDKSGNEYIGEGVEIHLPQKVLEEVKNGGWFGDAIRIYSEEYELDENLITRETPFTEAIQRAYGSYIKENGDLEYRKKCSAVVINDKNEILLVQLHAYNETDWNVPGGGIDEGETPEECILRELGEELGTNKFEIFEKSDIVNKYLFPDFLVADNIKDGKSKYKGQEQLQFIVKFTGKGLDIKIQEEEVRKYKWVKHDELGEYLLFEGQLENIERVIAASSLKI